jgi:N-acetylneuraminic acid mutarotase
MVAVGNRIYVIGGFGADPVPDTLVLIYDADARTWSQAAPVPEALHHAAAAVVDGKIYLVGGFEEAFATRDPVRSVWVYDPGRVQWEARAPLPRPRGALAVAVLDGRIYALGGERRGAGGGTPGYVPVDDATVYDPRTDTWEVLPPLHYHRDHLVAGTMNGHVYAVAGRDRPVYDLPFVEEFDTATRTWTERAPMPTGRSGCVAAVLDGRLYVFGGEGNPDSPYGTYDQVEAYDAAADAWTRLPRMPIPRHAAGAVVVGHQIFLPGGSLRQGSAVTALMDAFDPG